MFDWLRRRKKRVYIIMVFAMAAWGIGYSASYLIPQKPAGIIMGKKVSQEEFNDAMTRWHRVFFRQGDLPLNKLVWEQMTLAREAARMGIVVTNDEILERIQSMAIAMLGRTANLPPEQMIPALCQSYTVTEDQLLRTFGEALLIEKMNILLAGSVKVTAEEAWDRYAIDNEEVKIEYLALKAKDLAPYVEATEEEITSFYNTHKDRFPDPARGTPGYREPQKVKIEYIMARYRDVEPKASVTEEEVKGYYEENKDRRYKIEEKKEAEALKYKPFQEVKEEIKETLTRNKAKEMVTQLIGEADGKIYESLGKTERMGLSSLADSLGLFYNETGYFTQEEAKNIIKDAEEMVYSMFFQREEYDPSPPLDAPAGKFIFQVTSRKEPQAPPLEEVKKKVEEELREEKALLKAKEIAQLALERIKQSSFEEGKRLLEEESKKIKAEGSILQKGETEFFARPQLLEGRPYRYINALEADVPNLATEAFKLKDSEVALVAEKAGKKACYILRLASKKEADKKNFQDNKEKLIRRYLAEKQQDFLAHWSQRLKEMAELHR
ncbi:MAG TPA: peptidyl-prolyl cis-trans isomerase [Candidatus Hypogeohydataceae bacterium YC38]